MHKGKFTVKSIVCFLSPHLKLIVDTNYVHSPKRILIEMVVVLSLMLLVSQQHSPCIRCAEIQNLKGGNKAGKCYIHLLFKPPISVALWNFPELCYKKNN